MKFQSILLFVLFLISVSPASATNFYVGINAGILQQEGTFSVIDDTLNPSVNIDRPKHYDLPDGSDLTYSLYAGYKLASDLFLEVGFASNAEIQGEVRAQPPFVDPDPNAPVFADRAALEDYETDYVYVAFVGIWPVQNNWAFSARLGFSIWNIDYTQYSSDIPTTGLPTREELTTDLSANLNDVLVSRLSDNTSALLLGFGVSYALDQNIEFKLSLESHLADFSFTNLELDYDAASLTLGAAYHF